MAKKEGKLIKNYRNDFSGGINYFLDLRQIKDNESPNATNCDFKGKTGIGNRQGYTEIGSVTDSRTKIYGLTRFKTASVNQIVKFASDGADIELYYSTGGAWTEIATSSFTDAINMDVAQAGGKLYTFNGTDNQYSWDGTTLASYAAEGKTLLYGEYYNKRLWGVSPTSPDTLYFSTQYGDATKSLSFNNNGTSSNPGSLTFNPGSGEEIRAIKKFKDYLYIWLSNAIYRLSPASAANTFTVELVTKSVGCVSHRSVEQVGEDVFFAANDGIYSLGEVANYTSVRTTNKSARIQDTYDAITGTNKRKIVGAYFNFKYHMFYSLFGVNNDSCMVFDVRFNGWQDWRNIPANDAVITDDSTDEMHLYFGDPTTGEIQELYNGSDDDGTAITSTWYSKSFDEDTPDVTKLYFDTTFIFGAINGTVNVSVIFNDSEVTASGTISQLRPQGGYGRDAYGIMSYGDSTNTVTVTNTQTQPQRLRAKGQKFAIQYKVVSSDSWRLDKISQTHIPFNHYKFPSANKLN